MFKKIILSFFLLAIQIGFIIQTNASDRADDYVDEYFFSSIYNIIDYVKWNSENSDQTTRTINICILNENSTSAITLITPSKKHSWWSNLIFLDNASDINKKDCNVLYFGHTFDNVKLSEINLSKNTSMLSISTVSDFIKNGGIIHLKKEADTVRIFVNRDRLDKMDFTIDPEFIQISTE